MQVVLNRDLHVLPNGEFGENTRHLELDGNSLFHALEGTKLGNF